MDAYPRVQVQTQEGRLFEHDVATALDREFTAQAICLVSDDPGRARCRSWRSATRTSLEGSR